MSETRVFEITLGPVLTRSAGASHVGRVRKRNEDAFSARAELGLWVVADGMGGHERGDHASSLVAETMARIAGPLTGPALLAEVRTRLEAVNDELREEARDGHTSASTVVCLLISGWGYACVWAGDSRLYLVREGRASRVSHDHSVVQELVDGGALSEEAAVRHPNANEVTRAIGAFDELELGICNGRVQPGDVFMLCSDGLTKLATDAEIADVISGGNDPAAAVDTLVQLALDRGGIDNVTVIAVWCAATEEEDGDTLPPWRARGE